MLDQAIPLETPRSGRDALFANEGGFLQEDINRNAPRYFVQMGWHCLPLSTQAIEMSRLWRAEIMPCRTFAATEHLRSIPETMRIPGSNHSGPDGKLALTKYRRFAWDEAERLLLEDDSAQNLGRCNGLHELKSLYSDLGNRVYREINLTSLYLPMWPNLPELNMDLLALLRARLDDIQRTIPEEVLSKIPANLINVVHPVIVEVGEELIKATQRVHDLQSMELMQTHIKMKAPRGTENFKDRYDLRDMEILKRTGLPKFDAADVQTASALELLAKNGSNDALLKYVETQQEQMTLMREQMAQTNQLLQTFIAAQMGGQSPAILDTHSPPKIPTIKPKS